MSIGYAWEKLMKAVHGMAASSQSIQQRIANAYIFNLVHISQERDLPTDSRSLYEEISSRLTSVEAVGEEGTVQATVASMSDEDAEEIAYKIVRLYDEVSSEYRDFPNP